jgi:pyrimidine deaminase RibD-like protein
MNVVAGTETADESFMRRALLASQKALPACLPNPPVGCILVREGAVLSTPKLTQSARLIVAWTV